MIIQFSPMRSDAVLTLERQGEVLIVNGAAFDFSDLPEGGCRPRAQIGNDWFAGDVTRDAGMLRVALILPHGADAGQNRLFPAPLLLVQDGVVDLPL